MRVERVFLLLFAGLALASMPAGAQGAVVELKDGGKLAVDEERAPTYFFLLALAYRGSGDATRQKLCLDKVVSLAADTDLGVSAARLRDVP